MLHYFNNAGAGLMNPETFKTITDYLELEMKIGAYHAAQESKKDMENFYSSAAKLVNAENASEIAFMDSASRGWNMAIQGCNLQQGDNIVTLSSEFGTNLITIFNYAKKVGATVQVIECDSAGRFSIDDIERALEKGTRLVAISHAVAQGSIVNPVAEIGNLANRYNAIYIVDGCQAIGQIPVNVKEIQCDAYVATGRKWLCGPRGTGFLYVNATSGLQSQQLDLASADLIIDQNANVQGVTVRADARQFELWERSIACMLGLSKAINIYISQDQDKINKKISTYATIIRKLIIKNEKINLLGEVNSQSGIIGFYFNNIETENKVRQVFEHNGIAISTMSDWDCPLHFPKNGASTIFRLSPHYFNSEESISVVSEIILNL